MKTILSNTFKSAAILLIGSVVLIYSCSKEDDIKPSSTNGVATQQQARPEQVTSNTIVHLRDLVVDNAGNPNPAISPSSLIYNAADNSPITDTYGNTITYGTFMSVAGQATVKCVNGGTNFTINMTNLIPKGIYTLWVQTFKAPGYDGTMNNLIGYGPADGHNNFRASNNGTAQLSVTLPPGDLSMLGIVNGTVGSCLITSEYEFHLIGIYQTNGQTYGWTPGREGIFVEHFRYIFKK